MRDHLLTYLNDHLSGARFALDLLDHVRDRHGEEPFGVFAAEMLHEIRKDRAVLEQLLTDLDGTKHWVKQLAGTMAEKFSRVKLRLGAGDKLAEFETLEALSLGVLGKLKLWAALSTIAHDYAALQNLDLPQLSARAKLQHDEIERLRLKAAHTVLADQPAQV